MEPTVTIHQTALDDLMAVAHLTRTDHRDILTEAVEEVRARHLPKPKPAAGAAKPGRPKAQP